MFMNIVNINLPEDLVAELINQPRKPFKQMSLTTQKILFVNANNVEYYSTDYGEWIPATINPRHWLQEAYRLDLKKEPIPLFVRVC